MKKVGYTIGQINQWASLRFTISLKTQNTTDFCITKNIAGDSINIRNLYPSINLIIRDEIRDTGYQRGWTPDKMVSWSRFSGPKFVRGANEFIRKYKETQDLFVYYKGELLVNQQLAEQIKFTELAEFERRILCIPVVGKDLAMNQLYEGISMFFGNMSTYVIFTYDEFVGLVKYLEGFNYDLMALQLLNIAIGFSGMANIQGEIETSPEEPRNITKWVDKPPTIPTL